MPIKLKILLLESYYGGSHRNFADGLAAWSRHDYEIIALPPRHWKWRMRGSALHFSETIKGGDGRLRSADALFVTDMTTICELRAGIPDCPPIFLYFHESQLGYPSRSKEERDFQYDYTDIMNARFADHIAFNSRFHRDLFMKNASALLRRLPGPIPSGLLSEIKAKTTVLYPGILPFDKKESPTDSMKAPLLIWNHRWEYDKNPADLLKILSCLREAKFDFSLALLGESYSKIPAALKTIREEFGKELIHWGFMENYEAYRNLLDHGDFILSTALQENFGIAVQEGIIAGGFPILPRRLAYPELIPEVFHEKCLFQSPRQAAELIIKQWKEKLPFDKITTASRQHDWRRYRAADYDNWIERGLNQR